MARGFNAGERRGFGASESLAQLSKPTKTNIKRRLYRYAGGDYDDDSSYSYIRKKEFSEILSKLGDRVLKNLSVAPGTKIFRGAKSRLSYDQLAYGYAPEERSSLSFTTSVKEAKWFGKKIYTNDDLVDYKAAISMPKLFKWLGMSKEIKDFPDDVKHEVFVIDAKWKDGVDSSSWNKEERARRSKLK